MPINACLLSIRMLLKKACEGLQIRKMLEGQLFEEIAAKPFLLNLFSHHHYKNFFKKEHGVPASTSQELLTSSRLFSKLINNEHQVNLILANVLNNECFDVLTSEYSIRDLFFIPDSILLDVADLLGKEAKYYRVFAGNLSIKINKKPDKWFLEFT